MTGAHFHPVASDELELGAERHGVQWVGTPGVKGPSWAKLPLLTVGMLGTQVVWSIEMAYASPFLIELGLSKSWMSLVFMAGPLSGLIMQPLVGAYADRCRSRFGRRRPFMLIGSGIAAFGMVLLGWCREIAGWVTAAAWAPIVLAVIAIYLIDFSINAVMSTDRALIVDTLPPSQQENGNAWGSRMMGAGALAGFFVGNIKLPAIMPLLGSTQLQILSFLTSVVLLMCHVSTSWAVTERVLLRDDREQSKSGLLSSIRAIWANIFTLPPGIRMVCFIQFFAQLGWYPVMFFTSIWVSDIYRESNVQGDLSDKEFREAAERAGSRALFFQAVITIIVSIGAPLLVSQSGVQAVSPSADYLSVQRGDDDDEDGVSTPNSAVYKHELEVRSSSWKQRAAAAVDDAVRAIKTGSAWALPIQWLTLVRLWWMAQILFAVTMALTTFTTSVGGAYFLIGVTGVSWALTQWAPFALIGELVLIDGTRDQTAMQHLRNASTASVVFEHNDENDPLRSSVSRRRSHETVDLNAPPPFDASVPPTRPKVAIPPATADESDNFDHDTTVILRHSDDFSVASQEDIRSPLNRASPTEGNSTADKAGIILGIHNVFIVLPQFVSTGISSLVFAIMAPGGSKDVAAAATTTARAVVQLATRAESAVSGAAKGAPNAVGVIFRIGGLSAAIGAYLAWRLGRRWAQGRPA
ncbi:hypothetical protein Q8F55_001324 [Vanrija albida]|uniref:Major facilitator superfamily (MFS) profile domain-containing protein n=1 Tax=Vanrija albida TaxID=181172 RepID=A0ABR3QFQ9_9TREE